MSSELLGSAQNVLKGNLGGAWDINKGYADAYTDLGIARRFGGASAAYSLRDIGAMNGSVVRVRREPHDTSAGIDDEINFSANQVQSGALEDWVNGKLEDTLPADVATSAAAYSLRKVKASYSGDAVRIRRSSDDVEVDVAFDSDDKVSASSAITNIAEQGGEIGSTTATDLNGFLNETLSNRFSAVDYPSGIGSNFRKWSALTATSNSFVATTGTFADNSARYNYVLPETITASEAGNTTFRFSGTVDYTASGGTGIIIKAGTNATASSTATFANQTSTGVGTIASNAFKFVDGDSGDFLFEFTGNGSNAFRSIVFSQTIVSSGSSSISLTNLKFEIIKHGATVHTWYDQAGSNNAVQETAANQPKIAESGALLADGLLFDGSNGVLVSTSFSATQPITTSAVFKSSNTSDSQTVIGGVSSNYIIHRSGSAATAGLNAGTLLAPFSSITSKQLMTTLASGTSSTVSQNGVISSTGNAGTNNQTDLGIGSNGNGGTVGSGSAKFDGSIEEVIVYDSDQSANRFKIESNINNYYGLYNDANELAADFAKSGLATISNTSKDEFTGETTDGNDAYFGVELNDKVASADIIYISFNSTKALSSGVGLRETIAGTLSQASITSVSVGFNSIALTSNNNDAKFISFVDDTDTSFTISDFKVSRIARNGFVQTWYDQSSNGIDMAQTTAADQPHIVENGGICKDPSGNNPTVKFVNVGTNLGSTFMTATPISGGQNPFTHLLVASSTNTGASGQTFVGCADGVDLRLSTLAMRMRSGNTNRTTSSNTLTSNTNSLLTYIRASGRVPKMALNNNALEVESAAPDAGSDNLNEILGENSTSASSDSFGLVGTISESILYTSDKNSESELSDLKTDIDNHYNIF
jgi:hypothetical protein